MLVCKNIKKIRKSLGLTQVELAKAAGISQGNLTQYERGSVKPKVDTLNKIAQALGVPVENFFEKSLRENLTYPEQLDAQENKLPLILLTKESALLQFSPEGQPQGKEMIYIAKPTQMTDPNAYAAKLSDDSMSPGIEKSWMILVSPDAEVKENDYVVARLPSGELLLRKLHMQDKKQAILRPLSFSFKPISILKTQLKFMHKVVNIIPS